MRGDKTVPRILLIFSIANVVLSAPVMVQQRSSDDVSTDWSFHAMPLSLSESSHKDSVPRSPPGSLYQDLAPALHLRDDQQSEHETQPLLQPRPDEPPPPSGAEQLHDDLPSGQGTQGRPLLHPLLDNVPPPSGAPQLPSEPPPASGATKLPGDPPPAPGTTQLHDDLPSGQGTQGQPLLHPLLDDLPPPSGATQLPSDTPPKSEATKLPSDPPPASGATQLHDDPPSGTGTQRQPLLHPLLDNLPPPSGATQSHDNPPSGSGAESLHGDSTPWWQKSNSFSEIEEVGPEPHSEVEMEPLAPPQSEMGMSRVSSTSSLTSALAKIDAFETAETHDVEAPKEVPATGLAGLKQKLRKGICSVAGFCHDVLSEIDNDMATVYHGQSGWRPLRGGL